MYESDNRRPTYDGILTKAHDPLEVRADAEKGLLTGYASKFWVVDSYAEATAPGSFAKTIADRGPQGADRILLRYEHEYTIGKHTAMKEDGTGLAIEARVSDDGMYGTAVRRQLADDVPYGLSIGFRRVGDRTAEENDPLDFTSAPAWVAQLPRNEIRILTDVRLMENSVVSFPAVDPAMVNGYRSDNETDLETLIAAVKAGRLTAEQTHQLRALLTETPADSNADSETPAAVDARTATRKRQADLLALQTKLQGLGVSL